MSHHHMFSISSSSSSSSSESMMEENIKHSEEIINKWRIDDHSCSKFISIFHENNKEATIFFNCIKDMHKAMHFLASSDMKSSKLSVAQRLMKIAMKRLEKEFHFILSDNQEYSKPKSASTWSSSSSRSHNDSKEDMKLNISPISISNLRLIADTMISSGYGKECIAVYKIVRKSTIDEALFHLKINHYKCSYIKKILNAPDFDKHVKIWLYAAQIAVKTLFYNEKLLCDNVFSANGEIGSLCFMNSTKEAALNLFTFPELVATKCNVFNSETIFVIMDLYNSISYLWPEIELLFSNELISPVKNQALLCLHKLSDSVRTFLSKLESSIQKNSSKLTVSGGGIHPLNNSVMTYLSSLSDYGLALNEVIVDKLSFKEDSFLKSYLLNTNETSPQAVSVSFAWIILVLLCKLDGKAKFHDYAALSYLFLVNNLNFIIEKVRATNLKFILGKEWVVNHEDKLKQYVSSYKSMSWSKVVSCLPESCSLMSPDKVKACFRKLYFMFEEVYGRQMEWIVVDETMRVKMKASIACKLVPAYEEFYLKHLVMLSGDERCLKMLVRLSPENMAKYLTELFPGTGLRSSWSSNSSLA